MREAPSIDGFGGGGFRVSGVWRPGSLLIVADEPRDWSAALAEALTMADFADVTSQPRGVVEFVLLGTGRAQALPPRAVRDGLRAAGLGLEFMATDAAARMHNVLASEGRMFATALIAV
ncbi:MAG: Mth938-like domain-containing protein [Caulobacterales bacterium]